VNIHVQFALYAKTNPDKTITCRSHRKHVSVMLMLFFECFMHCTIDTTFLYASGLHRQCLFGGLRIGLYELLPFNDETPS